MKRVTPFLDRIMLGRLDADVVVTHITVSRFHGFFRQRDGQWYVCDCDSKHGTYLCGRKLTPHQEVDIRSGDAIQFGDVVCIFYSLDDLFELIELGKHAPRE